MINIFDKITDQSYALAKKGDPLFGAVSISGAKNMVTKIMTACLLAKKGKLIIRNVPFIGEVFITLRLFDQLGVNYKLNADKTLEIEPQSFRSSKVKFEGNDGNRISLLLAGPVLAQFGEATIAKPKGCKIGLRKIDFHIQGLEKFGTEIKETNEFLFMKLGPQGLKGTQFRLPFPSVGATENLLITAVSAKGESIIDNCAVEPEIIELVKFLQGAGVEITLNGDRSIRVQGAENINLSEFTVIPDRVETVSLAAAALATKGDVFLKDAKQDLIVTFLGLLEKMGAGIEIKENGIRIFYKQSLKPISIATEVYPGLVTDFQQPLAILLSQVQGISHIHETIFEKRFDYLELLNPLIKNNKKFAISDQCPKGQECRFSGQGHLHFAEINGPIELGAGQIAICDLRAGFALLTAGLLSDGLKINNLKLLFRGYEDPIGKLKSLGADIELKI